MSNSNLIEERLERITNSFDNIHTIIDNLDFDIPDKVKDMIMDVLSSDDIQNLIDGIKTRRPPRIIIMGRSGVGKSSLINALFDTYLAETSPINVGTLEHKRFSYKKEGKVIFEIIDTRGISENIKALDSSAEEDLYDLIEDFNPDAFLFLTNGADRSTLSDDTEQLKRIYRKMNLKTPLITVITRVDEIEPARIKLAEEYTDRKLKNIRDKKNQVKQVLRQAGIDDRFVVPVSSYIEWDHEDPDSLTEEEKEALKIAYDGRYNIDELINVLEDNIEFSAAIDMMLNHEVEKSLEKIAQQFVKKFSSVSFVVGATPIPIMDIFVLLPIQIVEVIVIGYLSGEEVDAKAAREFIMSLGAVFLFGYSLRFVAQEGSRLLNLVPGAGTAVGATMSGSIAYSGTYSVGKAAIAHYIRGGTMQDVKSIAVKAKEEAEQEEINLEDSNLDEAEIEEMVTDINEKASESELIETEEEQEDEESKFNLLKQGVSRNFRKTTSGVKKGFVHSKTGVKRGFKKVRSKFSKNNEDEES